VEKITKLLTPQRWSEMIED